MRVDSHDDQKSTSQGTPYLRYQAPKYGLRGTLNYEMGSVLIGDWHFLDNMFEQYTKVAG